MDNGVRGIMATRGSQWSVKVEAGRWREELA